ncbi:MAG: hypothetical protein JWM16_5890 [Verrucomicrobiales bacterium]|nr:hypothetical protein [Verrucomicrobiales bacterium]
MKIQILIMAGLVWTGIATAGGKVTLTTGHTDMGVVYDNGEFTMDIHYDVTDTAYPAKQVILFVSKIAMTTVPSDPVYNFLGPAGAPVWILPQVQDPTLLFLGFGSDELPAGVFQNDTVRIQLKDVKGPGEFAMFASDPFGIPIPIMNTRDGISADDVYPFVAGSDAHFNFAFSKPGKYRVTLETTGTLPDGTVISTGDVTYTFRVARAGSPEL